MNRTEALRTTRAQGWVMGARRRTAPALRLFCLPYAGGNASAYTQWPDAFPDDVEVCAVELPGRQTRWRDDAFTRVEPLVEALASALAGELGVPYALFGHSMGSLVAFELARELRRRGLGEPRVLFVSGGPAPQLPREQPRIHDGPQALVVE
ncbi:thioesterase II family protein, partial [Micromonospora harpali]